MPPGRLVLTHTQHLPGLIWILRKIAEKSTTVQAIVPSRIAFVGMSEGVLLSDIIDILRERIFPLLRFAHKYCLPQASTDAFLT